MSETQLAKLNLDDAAKQLREKIRGAFVELIPPEQWEAMVKAEIDAFTKPRRNPNADRWNNQPAEFPSVFGEVAAEIYKEHVKTLFRAELAKPEWSGNYNTSHLGNPKNELASLIKDWLTENAQLLLQTTLKELFGYEAQNMINRLRSP